MGKTVRGAKDTDGSHTRLLAALLGPTAASSVIAARTEVGAKTDEVRREAPCRIPVSVGGTWGFDGLPGPER